MLSGYFVSFSLQTFVAWSKDKQRAVNIKRSSGIDGDSKYHSKHAGNGRSVPTTIAFLAKLWIWWPLAFRWSIYKAKRKCMHPLDIKHSVDFDFNFTVQSNGRVIWAICELLRSNGWDLFATWRKRCSPSVTETLQFELKS